MKAPVKFHAERVNFGRGVNVYVHQVLNDGSVMAGLAMAFQRLDFDAPQPPAALSLSMNEAQALMDSLWDAGLRPTEGSGSAGALAATQEHLKDMRRIAFELLNCETPTRL